MLGGEGEGAECCVGADVTLKRMHSVFGGGCDAQRDSDDEPTALCEHPRATSDDACRFAF